MSPSADDDVEVIEDITAENVHVSRLRIGKGGKLAADASRAAILASKLQHSREDHEGARATDTLERQARRRWTGGQSQVGEQGGAEHRVVRSGVHEEPTVDENAAGTHDVEGYCRASHTVGTQEPFTADQHVRPE